MRCYYHPDYYLPLPPGHPFPMAKFPQARALLNGGVTVEAPPPLTRSQLEAVHEAGYLDAVSFDRSEERKAFPGLSRTERTRLGLPAHPRLLQRSALEAAGTVAAARAALEDGLAANLAGGTHHAFPAQGQGYCVLNDIALAIAELRRGGEEAHILIVDTDAHQGNGNHAIFAGDVHVFTYSLHVGRNYPSRKVPGDLDVPVERYVDGEAYLERLTETLPPVFARTEPDLVFWISGADNHEDDRFGQMRLSDADMARRDRLVLGLCLDFASPTVVVYGGGYNRTPGHTAALHAQTIRLAAAFAGTQPWKGTGHAGS